MTVFKSLTWAGLCKWWTSELTKHPDLENNSGADPSACWVGARFIIAMLDNQLDNTDHNKYDFGWYDQSGTAADVQKLSGVVHFSFSTSYEMHYFSACINTDLKIVTIFQTYGGINALSIYELSIYEWSALIGQIECGDGNAWRKLFRIPIKYKIPETTIDAEFTWHKSP